MRPEKVKEILDYCRPHMKFMWAAKIVSVILDCDFRDAELELKVYDKLQKLGE